VKKRGFVILAILLLLEILWAGWYLLRPRAMPRVSAPPPKEQAETVFLSLSPPESEFFAGQEAEISIALSAGPKKVIGSDAVLAFDESKLEVTDIIPGDIFSIYPLKEVRDGKIFISGVLEPGETFSGYGILAKLKLRGLATGAARLNFDFIPEHTDDSNVAQEGGKKDLLEKVVNGLYTFK